MNRLKIGWLFLVFLCSFKSIFPQNQNTPIVDDSGSRSKVVLFEDSLLIARPDTLSSLLLQTDSLRVKLLFKNDHCWNNWAIDTTLTAKDFSGFKAKLKRPPYKLTFKHIPLNHALPSKKEKIKKYLKPGLATLALLSNWSSFYFKRVADDYYDRYKYTSDLQKIRYYYHKTQQFDRVSNVLLTVSVVSLSVYLYLLLQ